LEFVTKERLGVTGFCLGGGLAYQVSTMFPFDTAVAFLGVNPKPLEAVVKITSPVLGIYAGEDGSAILLSSLRYVVSNYNLALSSHDLIRRSLLVQLVHGKSCIPYAVLFKHYFILLILDKAFRYWQVGR
jgi:hypothetical protein